MRVERGENWEMRLGHWQDSPPEMVDHIITDPPFSEHVHSKPLRHGGNSPGGFYESDLSFEAVDPPAIVPPLLEHVRRWFVAFCSIEHVGPYADAAGPAWVRACVWIKPDATPQFTGDRPAMWGESIAVMHNPGRKTWNAGGKRGCYTHNRAREDRVHETQKPVALMLELVNDFTDEGDLIWDPYAGSATTGVAALSAGRRFIGHEMQERYFEIACERLRAAERGQDLASYQAGQEVLF